MRRQNNNNNTNSFQPFYCYCCWVINPKITKINSRIYKESAHQECGPKQVLQTIAIYGVFGLVCSLLWLF